MGIWWLCRTIVHHSSVGLLSLTHASMDSDYHPITLCLPCSQKPPKDHNVLRTFHSPSEYISPAGSGFCFVVQAQLPNPLCVLSKTQPRLDDEYTYGRKNRVLAIVWFKGKNYAMLFLSKIRCVLSRKGYFLIQKYASLHSLQK